MKNNTTSTVNSRSIIGDICSWFFGILFLAIGLINTFWGNNPGYGIFVALLAFLFSPPVHLVLKRTTGFALPLMAKILLGVFILWSALGVAELFDKINLMLQDF